MKLWDTCSWKKQLEKKRSLKVLSWKVWSWKELTEVGKLFLKLESSVFNFIDSFRLQTSSVTNFSGTFQVQPELFNCGQNFPASVRNFQLRPERSNFDAKFPTSFFPILCRTFQLKTFQLIFFQQLFPTTRFPKLFFNTFHILESDSPGKAICGCWKLKMTKRTKILLRSYAKLIPIMDFCGFESKMMGII